MGHAWKLKPNKLKVHALIGESVPSGPVAVTESRAQHCLSTPWVPPRAQLALLIQTQLLT